MLIFNLEQSGSQGQQGFASSRFAGNGHQRDIIIQQQFQRHPLLGVACTDSPYRIISEIERLQAGRVAIDFEQSRLAGANLILHDNELMRVQRVRQGQLFGGQ
ncbi:hypothetical protein D3C79_971350 [compost metagenome]